MLSSNWTFRNKLWWNSNQNSKNSVLPIKWDILFHVTLAINEFLYMVFDEKMKSFKMVDKTLKNLT